MRRGRGVKITALDAFILLALLGFGVFLAYRVEVGVSYHWRWEAIPKYLIRCDPTSGRWRPNLLLNGLFTTIRLSIWAALPALCIGTAAGLWRTSRSFPMRMLGGAYVELIRNIPPLVLVFIFYFFLSDQIMAALDLEERIRSSSAGTKEAFALLMAPPERLSGFISGVLTLGLYEGAYIAEIVRAGIRSVDKGQWEASQALGFSRRGQLQHVILPQAFSNILPPLAGQFISIIKDSAIVSVVSIPELTFQGMELMASTYLTFEIWITITVMYFLLGFACSLAVKRLESRMRKD
ncbi:MAG: amino acid ABC transporter permease [Syntrophobacteraceae bacterium]